MEESRLNELRRIFGSPLLLPSSEAGGCVVVGGGLEEESVDMSVASPSRPIVSKNETRVRVVGVVVPLSRKMEKRWWGCVGKPFTIYLGVNVPKLKICCEKRRRKNWLSF